MKIKELFETGERSILSVLGQRESPHQGWFDAEKLRLTSLEGSPRWCRGGFDISHNLLTSLEGAPEFIDGELYAYDNQFTSLKNIHKFIKQINGSASFRENPIKSHVLGLLKIRGLKQVALGGRGTVWAVGGEKATKPLYDVAGIINKHLEGDRDIFACQEELIDAGYPEYAQL